ncbi:hypothetical protein CES85_1247 [Ochrobactrum quorumnocens]|uniref:Uncharacterized protein n=1 Tax=Ochrobactrum quorumnocens TaxID=271865 RepID=A0A248UEZ9_9HYPH|nr:hypothetical protein CES85_1247 [[Ochrobactrum] quorumnocens]
MPDEHAHTHKSSSRIAQTRSLIAIAVERQLLRSLASVNRMGIFAQPAISNASKQILQASQIWHNFQ